MGIAEVEHNSVHEKYNTDPSSHMPPSRQNTDDNLVDFIETLQKIDTKSPLAKLNETTIADNNGGRIEL